MALQQIQTMKEAAASELSRSMGQNNPTVADSLKSNVMNSQRNEVAKSLGLAGLASAQQQATPQGGPQGAPQGAPQGMPQGQMGAPQGAPQMMAQGAPQGQAAPGMPVRAAKGGLMYLPTNLPKQYANGGIIAFNGQDEDVGSVVPDNEPGWLRRKIMAMLEQANESAAASDVNSPNNQQARARIQRQSGTTLIPPESAKAPPSPSQATAQDYSAAAQTEMRRPPPPPVAPKVKDSADVAPAKQVQAPAVAKASPLDTAVEGNILKTLALDKDKEASDQGVRRDAAYAPGMEKILASKRAGLAQLDELQKRSIAERPSDWNKWLQLIGRNSNKAGLGGAFSGVAEGMDATREGYTKQEIEYAKQRQALDEAMQQAIHQNNIGRYNDLEKARDQLDDMQSKAATTGASVLGHRETAASRKAQLQAANQSHQLALLERKDRLGLQKMKDLSTAEARIVDDYVKPIEEAKRMMIGKPDSPIYKQHQERVDSLIQERDRRLKALYAQYGEPLPAQPAQRSSGGVDYSKFKPIK